jgi:hypothetical protein
MSGEITITQATERLQARGMDVARRTVASWVEQGLFTRRWVETPAGNYWVIPTREVESFEPPKPGRPPKSAPAPQKRATGHASAANGTAAKKKGGKQ